MNKTKLPWALTPTCVRACVYAHVYAHTLLLCSAHSSSTSTLFLFCTQYWLCATISTVRKITNNNFHFCPISAYVIRMGKQLKILLGRVGFQNVPGFWRRWNGCRRQSHRVIPVLRCPDRSEVWQVWRPELWRGSVGKDLPAALFFLSSGRVNCCT